MKQFTVKGHNWVSLTYCDFNLYLVITRLIHKFKTTGWLQGHLSLSSFWDWFNEYQEFLVKSKLSPHSGPIKGGPKVLYIGVFQIAVRGWGRDWKFYWGNFFTGWREPEEEWCWWFKPFLNLKTAFCDYWRAIKIWWGAESTRGKFF